MTQHPDHELEVLEDDETVPPRPEEDIADAGDDAVGVSRGRSRLQPRRRSFRIR